MNIKKKSLRLKLTSKNPGGWWSEGRTGERMEGQACVAEVGLKTKVTLTVQGAKAELAVTRLEPAE